MKADSMSKSNKFYSLPVLHCLSLLEILRSLQTLCRQWFLCVQCTGQKIRTLNTHQVQNSSKTSINWYVWQVTFWDKKLLDSLAPVNILLCLTVNKYDQNETWLVACWADHAKRQHRNFCKISLLFLCCLCG